MRGAVFSLSLSLLVISGCAPTWGFMDTSFQPELHHYDLAYLSPSAHNVVGDAWIAENFRMSGQRAVPIQTGAYRVIFGVDFDRDGRAESRVDAARVDLRLLHRNNGSVMWIRTVPLDFIHAEQSLETLAQAYVESLSGSVTYIEGGFGGPAHGVRRTHATQIVSATPTQIDGLEAYDVTLDLVDLDQRALDPTAISDRVRIVFARPRPGHGFQLRGGVLQTVVAFGHAARPLEFDATVPEFVDMIARVRWL